MPHAQVLEDGYWTNLVFFDEQRHFTLLVGGRDGGVGPVARQRVQMSKPKPVDSPDHRLALVVKNLTLSLGSANKDAVRYIATANLVFIALSKRKVVDFGVVVVRFNLCEGEWRPVVPGELACVLTELAQTPIQSLTLTEQRSQQPGSIAEPCRPRPPLPRGFFADRRIPQDQRYPRDLSREGGLMIRI